MNISLREISFGYSTGVPLLQNFSLNISSGSFAFVIGLNGSGKSTLLKLISRILSPTSGKIFLGKKNIDKFSENEFAQLVSYVPQNYSITFPLKVYDFVAIGRTPYINFYGTLKDNDKQIIERNLELLGISHIAKKEVTKISGGEFRRALIARALTQQPKVLLLDEPSAFLDIEHQVSIFELLEKINKEAKHTIVTVSHDLNLAGMFASDIVLLESGNVKQLPKSEILTRDKIKSHFGVNSIITKNNNHFNITITRSK